MNPPNVPSTQDSFIIENYAVSTMNLRTALADAQRERDLLREENERLRTDHALSRAEDLPPNVPSDPRRDERRTTRYEIREVNGQLAAIHERIEDAAGKKFIWRQPDGRVGLGGRKLATLPLYNAHLLKGWSQAIVIVEGEKAADALTRQQVPAVGTVTGASSCPGDDALRPLVGHTLVIWADADAPGRGHMDRIEKRLRALGASDIREVSWPNAPPGGDAADYPGDLAALVAAAAAVGVTPSATNTTPEGFALTTMADFLAEPEESVEWLVEDRIPAGGIVVMAAKPKAGKSTTARVLALAVARGEAWLGHPCHQGCVWYLAFEGRRRDIRAHFRQLGATRSDPLSVFVGKAPRDVVADVNQKAEQERPALIVIDTMQRFLKAKSTDDYAEMTLLLDSVIGIAQQSGATVLLLHHSGKADRASIDAVLGSTAITGSCDTIVLLTRSERYRTISTVQRVGGDLPDTVILLDEDTGSVRLGGSRKDAEREFMAQQLTAALKSAGRALTREEWLDTIHGRREVKLDALRAVTGPGNLNLVITGKGIKNDPHLYCHQDSVSGSAVPLKSREPESTLSAFDEVSKDSSTHSGSQVPVQREEVPAALEVADPAWLTDVTACVCADLGDNGPCGWCDGPDREEVTFE